MRAHDNANWLNDLQKIIGFYNSTPHHSLKGLTPNEVEKDKWKIGEIYMDKFLHNNGSKEAVEAQFKVGDRVRILLAKGLHDKEGQTFSTDIYTIDSIVQNKYKVMDEEGKLLRRGIKPTEMLKVTSKVRRVATPVAVPAVVKNQRHVRKLRSEGLTNEEESRELVDQVDQAPEPVRRSTRERRAPNRLDL